jgi:hypothetical protein
MKFAISAKIEIPYTLYPGLYLLFLSGYLKNKLSLYYERVIKHLNMLILTEQCLAMGTPV